MELTGKVKFDDSADLHEYISDLLKRHLKVHPYEFDTTLGVHLCLPDQGEVDELNAELQILVSLETERFEDDCYKYFNLTDLISENLRSEDDRACVIDWLRWYADRVEKMPLIQK